MDNKVFPQKTLPVISLSLLSSNLGMPKIRRCEKLIIINPSIHRFQIPKPSLFLFSPLYLDVNQARPAGPRYPASIHINNQCYALGSVLWSGPIPHQRLKTSNRISECALIPLSRLPQRPCDDCLTLSVLLQSTLSVGTSGTAELLAGAPPDVLSRVPAGHAGSGVVYPVSPSPINGRDRVGPWMCG